MAVQLTEEQTAFFKACFSRWFDKDGDGIITTGEFVAQMNVMAAELGKTPEELALLEDMVKDVEADRDGTININRFLSLMARTKAEVREPMPDAGGD